MRFLKILSSSGVTHYVPLAKIVFRFNDSRRPKEPSEANVRLMAAYVMVGTLEVPVSDSEADRIVAVLEALR